MTTTRRMQQVIVSIGVLVSCACGRPHHPPLTLAGSTAFQPIAEKLAEQYMKMHPSEKIHVQAGGSALGIQAALGKTADIGMADLVELPPQAQALAAVVVARDGIAIVVHPRNSLANLTLQQARAVFTGEIGRWPSLGVGGKSIRVISREAGSGTRTSFEKWVLPQGKLTPAALFQNSNGTVREAVASDPEAIGYLSLALVDERVKALSLDGIAANRANIKNGTYPLARPVFFLTNGPQRPAVQAFIDYVLSPPAQHLLEQEGLIAGR